MSIEIRELVIRAVAVQEAAEDTETEGIPREAPTRDRSYSDVIVRECVNQVLRILREKEER
jgi:hypothetical protein